MSSYVKGPWRASDTGTTITATLTYEHQGVRRTYEAFIARTPPSFADRNERVATARLIAAAPDLLEALQAILPDAVDNHIGGPDTQARIDAAQAAIAKAIGGQP